MQTAMLVPVNGKLRCILFEDVLFIEAKNNYCEIVTVKKNKWLTSVTMSCLEQKLPENLFVRVHRSYIISLKKMEWLHGGEVKIADCNKIAVSKEGYKRITQRVLLICPEFDKKLKNEIDGLSPEQYARTVKSRKKGG